MKLRIAGLVNDSIVDGPGFRLAVFTQGCPHNCPGCHNPETHDFNGGSDMDTAEIILTMEDNPLLDGVTLTGGDPFCQPEACLEVARAAHKLGLYVWAYSGWTYDQLLADPKMRAWWKNAPRCWRKNCPGWRFATCAGARRIPRITTASWWAAPFAPGP